MRVSASGFGSGTGDSSRTGVHHVSDVGWWFEMIFSEVDFLILGVQVCAHRVRHMPSSKVPAR